MRLMLPTLVPAGPRSRAPRRMKMGELATWRIVMFEIAMSSMCEPSTLSMAMPRESSNTQFVMVIFLKSPFDSVPSLMRPVR